MIWPQHKLPKKKKKERSNLSVLTAKIYWKIDICTHKETLIFVPIPIFLVQLPWRDQKTDHTVRQLSKASLYPNYHFFQESPENKEENRSLYRRLQIQSSPSIGSLQADNGFNVFPYRRNTLREKPFLHTQSQNYKSLQTVFNHRIPEWSDSQYPKQTMWTEEKSALNGSQEN